MEQKDLKLIFKYSFQNYLLMEDYQIPDILLCIRGKTNQAVDLCLANVTLIMFQLSITKYGK